MGVARGGVLGGKGGVVGERERERGGVIGMPVRAAGRKRRRRRRRSR